MTLEYEPFSPEVLNDALNWIGFPGYPTYETRPSAIDGWFEIPIVADPDPRKFSHLYNFSKQCGETLGPFKSGKTSILKALQRLNPANGIIETSEDWYLKGADVLQFNMPYPEEYGWAHITHAGGF